MDERSNKTRQVGLSKQPMVIMQKLFHTGGKKWPIAAYELLISKCPLDFKFRGPLYFTPL